MLSLHTPAFLRSGPLMLDAGLRQARSGTRVLAVSGLPLRILELLVEANGRLVSRTELKAKLWPHAVRINVDRRLNTAVRALRKALDDLPHEPGRIVTVRNYGYRWVAARPKRPGWREALSIAAPLLLLAFAVTADLPPAPAIAAAETKVRAADQALKADWNWRGAEDLYLAALQIRSDLPGAHRGLAWLYVNEGRNGEALPHIARLLEAPDPNPAHRAELGWLLLRAGKPDAALAVCSRPDERNMNVLSCRHTALAQLGLTSDARQIAIELMREADAGEAAIQAVEHASPAAGYARFLRWRVTHFVPPSGAWFQRAQLQAEAGQLGAALASLELAARHRDPLLVKIGSTAAFAPLEHSPRFNRISGLVLNKKAA